MTSQLQERFGDSEARVEAAIASLAAGRGILVTDDEDRETDRPEVAEVAVAEEGQPGRFRHGGVKVGEWYVISDIETQSHTGIRHDETRELIVTEVENSFEYYAPQLRVLFDDFDISKI